ncbi:hypothetical protein [Rhizobium sp. RU36D]|uniref:hypothetical protein n=1 Tax=Rhizobium sp. RU36D TaxID=1907415 RepID=UPI0009D90EEC|nr:hypothetical protein [Rhizobium sp. RU36D]SMD16413.1 hypothetical protein SAMN05880593_12979 [Rhizobium sp. RU36D]
MDTAPTLTPFGIAVIDMGLTPSQQQHILALAGRLKISQTDSDIVRICTYVKTEGTMQATLEKVEAYLAETAEKMDATASRISADIEERTNTLLSSVSTEIGNAIREKVDNLPDVISSAVDTHVQKRTDLIIEKTVIKTNNDRDRLEYLSERRKDRREYGMILIGVLALSIGLVAVTRSVTWDQATAMNARLEQMEKRPDLSVWLEWMKYNDARKLQAASCAPGQQFTANGQQKCRPDIALTPALQSDNGLDGLVGIFREIEVKLGTIGSFGLGVAATLLTMWTRRRLKTT